jgi:hypothetical protein
MKDVHNFPTSFVRFKAIKRYVKDENVRDTLSHFSYRYRTARAFVGIVAPDLEIRTINGYSAGMKLLLAFGAYDEVKIARKSISSLQIPKRQHDKIIDINLATKLRGNEKLTNFLTKTLKYKDKELSKDVKLFFENKNDDVLCVATTVRNAFAHGVYTPSSTGLTTIDEQKKVTQLANTVLDLTDSIATKCIDHFYKKYKGEK